MTFGLRSRSCFLVPQALLGKRESSMKLAYLFQLAEIVYHPEF